MTASANVELVRSIYAEWDRGDYDSAHWAHAEIEFVLADGPSPGSFKGLAGMAAASRGVFDVWEDYRAAVEEIREIDGGRVLVVHRRSGRGKTSGVDLGQLSPKGAFLFNVRDGKVTRFVRYLVREHALVDLGLAPDAGD